MEIVVVIVISIVVAQFIEGVGGGVAVVGVGVEEGIFD